MSETNYDALGQIAPNIDVSEIENDHMFLYVVVYDKSGSMRPYAGETTNAMRNFVKSIQDSKVDDEMLVSIVAFSDRDNITSTGFQNVANLNTSYNPNGGTAMYDAIILAADQLEDYMKQLNDSGVRTRGGLVIFSDGDDNDSKQTAKKAADTIARLEKKEIMVAFVAFGSDAHDIAQDLGIPANNTIETDATPSELRKIWGILSKSAISSSKSTAAGASQTSLFDI